MRKTGLGQNWITSSTYMWIDARSYKDSNGDGIGDLRGLISKLDYLRDLGIGVIMLAGLMPTDFAYAGTMVTSSFDVDPRLGSLEDFDALVREAHERGIAILIVWAPYSTHPDHSYFSASRDPAHPRHSEFADYYTWTSDPNTPLPHPLPRATQIGHWEWDEARKEYFHATWKTADGERWCPEANPYSRRMRQECRKVFRFWLGRGADGLWLDCADKGDFKSYRDHTRFWKSMNRLIHSYPLSLSVSEDGVTVSLTIGEEGFDQFKCGNYPVPVYDLVFGKPGRGTFLVGPPGQEWYGVHEALMSYYSDPGGNQCANWYNLKKASFADDPIEVAKVKQYYAMALTLPIVPKFIMGMELGVDLHMPTEWFSNLLLAPMRWDASTHGGFSTANPFVEVDPKRFPLSSTVEAQAEDSESIYNTFKRLANIRKRNPALQANAPIPRSYGRVPTQDDRSFYAYLRTSANPAQRVLVVHNLSGEARDVTCKFGRTNLGLSGTRAVRDLCTDTPEQPMAASDHTIRVPANGFRILEL